MEIKSINSNHYFKGHSQSDIFGYGDSVSQAKREYLRRHIDEKYMPNRDTFEQEGRMSEFEFNKLKSSLVKKGNPPVDDEKIWELGLVNCEPIGNNSYRGAMFNIYNMDLMPKLKEAGITQIVDLTFNDSVKNACKKNGIKYFAPLNIGFNSPAFKSKEDVKRESMRLNREFYEGLKEEELKKLTEDDIKNWEHDKRNFIDEFVEFIQTMEKGNVYIGCSYGSHTTDTYAFFNDFFNPKADTYCRPNVYDIMQETLVYNAETLYKNLTPEDKKKMGWDEEYEKEFLNKIEMYKEVFDY